MSKTQANVRRGRRARRKGSDEERSRKGRYARQKGHKFERDLKRLFDMLPRSSARGEDLRLILFSGEAKIMKRGLAQIRRWLEQAKANATGGRTPVLFAAESNPKGNWGMVAFELADGVALIRQLEDREGKLARIATAYAELKRTLDAYEREYGGLPQVWHGPGPEETAHA